MQGRAHAPAGLALAVMLALGPVLRRMRRELESDAALSRPTMSGMYACYVGHATATALAARERIGSLPLPPGPAAGAGCVLAAGGAGLCVAGMSRFAGPRQISGSDVGQLTIGGVYRYTRNPQYVGYVGVLVGVGLARRSSAVLGLAGAAALVFGWWAPVEERHLQREFGDAYGHYRARVPRWLGPPRTT